MFLGGLEVLVVLIFLVGGLIAGLIMWSTSGGGGSTEMSCGTCGYPVKGLTQLNCPECGVDLREAGIQQPGSPGKRRTGMILTIACGGLLLLACGTSVLMLVSDGSSSAPMPAVQAPSATSTAGGGVITTGPNGLTTITNPDGSQFIENADGSTTLVQPDGTRKTFDQQGNEIQEPTPPDPQTP